MDIAKLNSLSQEDFIQKFKNVVEWTPLCAAAISENRPFLDINDIYRKLCEFIDELPLKGKTALLRCFPDLAGRLAKVNALSAESTKEQASAGLNRLTREDLRLIDLYNNSYRQRFGFPFVICARLNNVQTIINCMKTRIQHDADKELNTGIIEAKKIVLLRLKDLVKIDSKL